MTKELLCEFKDLRILFLLNSFFWYTCWAKLQLFECYLLFETYFILNSNSTFNMKLFNLLQQ